MNAVSLFAGIGGFDLDGAKVNVCTIIELPEKYEITDDTSELL